MNSIKAAGFSSGNVILKSGKYTLDLGFRPTVPCPVDLNEWGGCPTVSDTDTVQIRLSENHATISIIVPGCDFLTETHILVFINL